MKYLCGTSPPSLFFALERWRSAASESAVGEDWHVQTAIFVILSCVDGELQEQPTFFLHLALDIRVIDDFAQGNAAEQWAQETFSPAAAVGTVEDSHAEVTGEVGPLSKHWVLHTTSHE